MCIIKLYEFSTCIDSILNINFHIFFKSVYFKDKFTYIKCFCSPFYTPTTNLSCLLHPPLHMQFGSHLIIWWATAYCVCVFFSISSSGEIICLLRRWWVKEVTG